MDYMAPCHTMAHYGYIPEQLSCPTSPAPTSLLLHEEVVCPGQDPWPVAAHRLLSPTKESTNTANQTQALQLAARH